MFYKPERAFYHVAQGLHNGLICLNESEGLHITGCSGVLLLQ